jgi:putative ABC transport system ATP-binding protein
MNRPSPLLTASGLGLSYGAGSRQVLALQDVSFSLDAGEAVAVTGPSGSGKSSLLSLLGAFLRPSAGDCLVEGRSLAAMTSTEVARYRAETLGFVFQQFCLLPHLCLIENVMLSVDHLHAEHDAWRERGLQLLDRVGLHGLQDRYPHEVSGGQAQRAAIARALLRGPRLVLADEPTGSLDGESAMTVMAILRSLCDDGCALVVVTHNEELAQALPRRLSLASGRLILDSAMVRHASKLLPA